MFHIFFNFSEAGTSNRFISNLAVWHTNSFFRNLLIFLLLEPSNHQFYENLLTRIFVDEKNLALDKFRLKYCLTFNGIWKLYHTTSILIYRKILSRLFLQSFLGILSPNNLC